jgi:nucleoside-diphosphate-sugar epimerase
MRILITGVSGFIGNKIFEYFSKNNDVYGIARSPLNNPKIKKVDLMDLDNIDFENEKFDIIFHCASILATNSNNKSFDLLYDNLKITEGLISIINKTSPSLVVNFSSIGVYPNVSGSYNEQSLINPSQNFEGLYGLSKFCSEELLNFFQKDSKIRTVNLRLGQTVGEGMRKDRVYSLMRDELNRDNCINVWGNGERISSFISIDVLLESLSRIIENKEISGTFNLTEKNISYLDLAKSIINDFGNKQSKIKISSNGNQSKVIIDDSKIKNLLE